MKTLLTSQIGRMKMNSTRSKADLTQEEAKELLNLAYTKRVNSRGFEINYSEKLDATLTRSAKWITESQRKWLMIAGEKGTGKTTLALAISDVMANLSGNKFPCITACRIEQIAKHDDYETFAQIKLCENLFIDDIGTEEFQVLSFGTSVYPIVQILFARYDAMLTTICSSNLTPERFEKRYGDRIADRAKEMFDWITITGKSYRDTLNFLKK